MILIYTFIGLICFFSNVSSNTIQCSGVLTDFFDDDVFRTEQFIETLTSITAPREIATDTPKKLPPINLPFNDTASFVDFASKSVQKIAKDIKAHADNTLKNLQTHGAKLSESVALKDRAVQSQLATSSQQLKERINQTLKTPLKDRTPPPKLRTVNPLKERTTPTLKERIENSLKDRPVVSIKERATVPLKDRATAPLKTRTTVPLKDRLNSAAVKITPLKTTTKIVPLKDRTVQDVKPEQGGLTYNAVQYVETRAVQASNQDTPIKQKLDDFIQSIKKNKTNSSTFTDQQDDQSEQMPSEENFIATSMIKLPTEIISMNSNKATAQSIGEPVIITAVTPLSGNEKKNPLSDDFQLNQIGQFEDQLDYNINYSIEPQHSQNKNNELDTEKNKPKPQSQTDSQTEMQKEPTMESKRAPVIESQREPALEDQKEPVMKTQKEPAMETQQNSKTESQTDSQTSELDNFPIDSLNESKSDLALKENSFTETEPESMQFKDLSAESDAPVPKLESEVDFGISEAQDKQIINNRKELENAVSEDHMEESMKSPKFDPIPGILEESQTIDSKSQFDSNNVTGKNSEKKNDAGEKNLDLVENNPVQTLMTSMLEPLINNPTDENSTNYNKIEEYIRNNFVKFPSSYNPSNRNLFGNGPLHYGHQSGINPGMHNVIEAYPLRRLPRKVVPIDNQNPDEKLEYEHKSHINYKNHQYPESIIQIPITIEPIISQPKQLYGYTNHHDYIHHPMHEKVIIPLSTHFATHMQSKM